MKKGDMIALVFLFSLACYLPAKTSSFTLPMIEVFYSPMDFNGNAVEGRKLYRFNDYDYDLQRVSIPPV